MTFNENPFDLPSGPDKTIRRSDADGLDLLADVVEKSSLPTGTTSKSAKAAPPSIPPTDKGDPLPSDEDSASVHSKRPPKKKSKVAHGNRIPKSPSNSAKVTQDDFDDTDTDFPKTPEKVLKKKKSNLKKDPTDEIPPFETPPQFYARMKKALPSKTCCKSELFSYPFPLDETVKSKFDAIDSDFWSDSFCRPFHLTVESDPAHWDSLLSKFDDVKTPADFQAFLEIHSKRNPLAFLDFDRKKNPVVIHNIFVSPDSGSVLAPDPVFLCFCKDSLDVPPGTFDPEELASIYNSLEYLRIPSFDEIVFACLIKDSDSLSGLAFDASKFSEFDPYIAFPDNLSDKKEDIEFRRKYRFDCKSIVLLPPSISGELIKFLDPSCHSVHKKTSYPKLNIPNLVAFIFEKILLRWRRSFEYPNCRPDSIKFSVEDPHCIRFRDTIRFLWGVNRGKVIVDDIFLDHPSDFGNAMTAVEFYFKTSLPDRLSAMYSTRRGPRPPASERSGNFSPSKSRRPIHDDPVDSSGNDESAGSPKISKDILYFTSQMTKSMSEHISNAMNDRQDKLTQVITQQSSIMKSQEDRLDHFKTFTIDTRNAIIYGQVGPHSTCLPSTPTEKAKEIFKQKNTHNLYTTIHSQVFRRSDNTCFLIFGQVGVIQKYGL